MKKTSAKERLLNCLKANVGKIVSRDELSRVSGVHEWQRIIRSLRQNDGWDIETVIGRNGGYVLHSLIPSETGKKREPINERLRYAVLQRDDSRCQRCGRGIKDGVSLRVDHKLPVDLGGVTTLDNLWTLCEPCNGGKKNLFSDDKEEILKEVYSLNSGYQRLKRYIELNPNIPLPCEKLQVISGVRDWTRSIRDIRSKFSMNIDYIPPNEEFISGAYIYNK